MKRGKPLRRVGFKRRRAEGPTEHAGADARPTAKLAPARNAAKAVMARVDGRVRAAPKRPSDENQHVRDMARGEPCMYLWEPRCDGGFGGTTVHSHENGAAANKGGHYKSHDWRGVSGCFWCHWAYDQGPASAEEKEAAHARAQVRQRARWAERAADPSETPKTRRAAQWALDRWANYRENGNV